MAEPQGQTVPAGTEPQGQPTNGQSGNAEPNGEQMITLHDGQKVTPEKAVKMLRDSQSEISRLQATAAEKKEKGESLSPEQVESQQQLENIADALLPMLEKRGLATSASVTAVTAGQTLDKFVADNPALAQHKELLTTLSKSHKDMALPDIVAKYNLTTKKTTATASGDVIGDSGFEPKGEMSVDDVTDADSIAKFEAANNIGNSKKFSMQPSVG